MRLEELSSIYVRIGFRGYTTSDLVAEGEGAITLSPGNIIDGKMDYSSCTYVSWEKYEESPEIKVNNNDIILVKTGSSYGKNTIVTDLPEKATINPQFVVIKNIICNTRYLYYVLNSDLARKQYERFVIGTSIPTFSQAKLNSLLIPLPPLEEQDLIVKKIDELFDRLDEIIPIEAELSELKSSLPENMKKSILLSAIKGNLSEQKKEEQVNINIIENLSTIEVPFTIPDNWVWVGHNDLFEVIGGSQPPKSKFSTTCKEGYIQLYQTRDYGPNPQPVYVNKKDVSKFSSKGDIILARYGGSLGKVFWAEEGAYNVALAKVVIKYPELINKKYLYYYYLADLYQSKVKNGNRSAQAGFSREDLNDLAFPLPPIEEQQRIVNKIEELLPLCNDIDKIVNV